VNRPRWWRLGAAVLVVAIVSIGAALSLTAVGTAGASAMPNDTTTSTLINAPGGIPSMLPQPNTGTAPRDADDRGGWAQYAVFYGILASGVLIFGLVMLESRRKLRALRAAEADASGDDPEDGAAQDEAASTRSEPVADTSV
jgi:hypothetical protein